MPKGTIRRLVKDRGFGFITTEEKKDLFFHRSEVQDTNFDSLKEGQQVEYEMGKDRDGRPCALKVSVVQTVPG